MRIIFLICVIAVSIFFFYPPPASSLRRVNVVLATSPVSLWSWDRQDGIFTVISLPSDVFIEADHGYGMYSLAALWKLGFIQDGTILASSLSHTIGIPIPWYVGTQSQELVGTNDVIAYGRSFFSVTNMFSFLFRRNRTNMPVPLYVSFARALAGAHADKIDFVDISRKPVTRQEDVPDNSKRNVIDQERIDAVFKGIFEDPQIRSEGISVALFNTTQTPALGTRAARLLTKLGVLVVSVGNQDEEIAKCRLEGSDANLATQTARSIMEILACDRVAVSESRRTDLTVKIGSDFASLFTPRE